MGDATASLVSESLSSTTAGTAVGPCKAVNVSLSGTWAGTVTLQRYYGGGWKDVASWTGNTEAIVAVSARQCKARLNFTRTSGTVVTVLEADDRMGVTGVAARMQVGGADLSSTNGLPVASAAGGASVVLTRTADTNAYTANDVIGAATGSTAAISFQVGRSGGGEFMITSLDYQGYAAALISGEANYRLHLYSVTPPSALGDNAAWDLPSGDRTSYLGYIDIPTPTDLGSTLYAQVDGINKQVTLASDTIYAYLVTIGAFTPASAGVRKITLHGIKV